MASKGKITELVDIPIIEKQIKFLNDGLLGITKNLENATLEVVKLQATFKDAKGIKELTDAFKRLDTEQQQAKKTTDDLLKASISLEKQRQKALQEMAKQEAKERQIIAASQSEGKTIDELKEKIKALTILRGKESAKTIEGKNAIENYNNKIKESKESLNNLTGSSIVSNKISDLVIKLGSVAGAMAVVKGGFEIYKKAVETSETASDKFRATMAGLETATMQFFRQLQQGDFSNLLSNMREAANIGAEYEKGLDLIGKTTKAVNVEHTKQKALLADLAEKIRTGVDFETGRIYTLKELKKYSADYIRIQKEYYNRLIEVADKEKEINLIQLTGLTNLNAKTKKTKEQVELELSNYTKFDAKDKDLRENAEKLNELLAEKQKIAKKTDIELTNSQFNNMTIEQVNNLRKEVKEIENRTDGVAQYAEILRKYEGQIGIEYIDKYLTAINKKSEADAAYQDENKRLKSKMATVIKRDAEERKAIENEEIKRLKELTELRTKTIEDEGQRELAILNNNYQDALLLAKGDKEKQKALTDAYNAEYERKWNEFNDKKIKAEKEANDKILSERKKQIDAIMATMSKENQDELNRNKRAYEEEQNALDKRFVDGLIKKEDYEREKLELSKKYAIKDLEAALDLATAVLAVADTSSDEYLQLVEARQNAELSLENAKNKVIVKGAEDTAKKSQEIIEESIQAIGGLLSGISAVGNVGFENQLTQINDLSKADEEAKEKELARAGDNQAKKDAINAKYDAAEKKREKERRKIEYERAVFQKNITIAGILLDTAANIVKVFPNFVLMALAGVTGALQLAAASAVQIPKYRTGVKNKATDGLADIVEDNKPELINFPTGQQFLATKPMRVFLPKGTDVIPNYELQKTLTFERIANFDNTFNFDLQNLGTKIDGLHGSLYLIADTIKNKAETNWVITASGMRKIVKSGSSQSEFIKMKFN